MRWVRTGMDHASSACESPYTHMDRYVGMVALCYLVLSPKLTARRRQSNSISAARPLLSLPHNIIYKSVSPCPRLRYPSGRPTQRPSSIIAARSALPAPTPHVLEKTVPLCQSVQCIVALAHRSHETAQRIDLVFARVSSALIDLSHRDLHRGVVLGLDDAVGR